jgi:hypothetical protein
MALEARVIPYGTILFIALILVVACSLLYWLSALCPEPFRSSGSPDAPGRTQGTSAGGKLVHRLRGNPHHAREPGADREPRDGLF